MDTFEERYSKLNPEQKEAVDSIDGPLLVVAGPGTGKTEILSLRVANILRQKAISPKNILCLTFTVSASQNMRNRLSELVGRDAFKVALHTFHSFGVDIIESYPEYFFRGTIFNPVDELTQIEILEDILSELPYDNDLGNLHPEGRYAYLDSIKSAIGDLKKAGIAPKEFRSIIEYNNKSLELLNPDINAVFSSRVGKKTISAIENFINALGSRDGDDSPFPDITSIIETVRSSLTNVLGDVEAGATTTPISEWKSRTTGKDEDGALILRDSLYLDKLVSLADVYAEYQERMYAHRYYDYDDMILSAIEGIEENNILKYELQDKYQYVLVDEFQDTNDAQMKLLKQITGKGIGEAKPNVMAVGDDDQAIYKFQGAQIKNILNFTHTYPDSKVVTITSNYRSKQEILDVASYVISQSEERLQNKMPNVQKCITSKIDSNIAFQISCDSFPTSLHEYYWIATKIKGLISNGTPPSDIAVIARYHRQLEVLSLLLNKLEVPLTYERDKNVLEEPHVRQLIMISRFIATLCRKSIYEADELLPEILSYPFWGLSRKTIWNISKTAHRSGSQNKTWLDVMLEHRDEYIRMIAAFLIDIGTLSSNEPLEKVLDTLMGTESELAPDNEQDEEAVEEAVVENNLVDKFVSPFKEYYFSEAKRKRNPLEYLSFLSSLRVFIQAIKDYKKDRVLKIEDLVPFVELHQRNDIPIIDDSKFLNANNAVNLLTAHKAKGLEFDTVFLVNCQEEIWSGGKRGSNLPMPINLSISPAGDTTDDQLRLFYVALTRAKNNLFLSSYQYKESAKESSRLPFIVQPLDDGAHTKLNEALALRKHDYDESSIEDVQEMLTLSWESQHTPPIVHDEKEALESLIEDYRLSVTHLNNFLNVTRGGPHSFFLQNLLRFPQSQNYNNSFGSSVHSAIEFIYTHIKKTGTTPGLEHVLDWFDQKLLLERMNERAFQKYSQKGREALRIYYGKKIGSFKKSHYSEFNFRDQGVVVGSAHLAGKIDKMVPVSSSEITVHDFKTGKAKPDWKGKDSNEKTLLHNYRRQLVFYKILVENSKDFGDTYMVNRGVLEFVEPKGEELIDLEAEIANEEVVRTEELINIVYNKIRALEFPNTGSYKNNLSGIIAFEDDLLDGKL